MSAPMDLTSDQYDFLLSHGITGDAQTAFIGPVTSQPGWLKFLSTKIQTRCMVCKRFMAKVPGDMVVVFSFEWHIHINCLGKAIDRQQKFMKEEVLIV